MKVFIHIYTETFAFDGEVMIEKEFPIVPQVGDIINSLEELDYEELEAQAAISDNLSAYQNHYDENALVDTNEEDTLLPDDLNFGQCIHVIARMFDTDGIHIELAEKMLKDLVSNISEDDLGFTYNKTL